MTSPVSAGDTPLQSKVANQGGRETTAAMSASVSLFFISIYNLTDAIYHGQSQLLTSI